MQPAAQKKRLYTTTQLSTITGKPGDILIDIVKNTVVVMNGSTSGGFPLALASALPPLATTSTAGLMSATDKTNLNNLNAITNATESVSGYMSSTDKTHLDALVSGGGPSGVSTNTPNTLVYRDSSGNFSANIITASLTGNVTGNASTATNGVVTTGSYSNPAWITGLDGSKITGTISCTISTTIPWTQISGRPTALSALTNDVGFITNSGTTTGASGSVTGQTSSPTASKVIVRDSSGRAQVAAPAAAADIATKAYVDASTGNSNNITIFNTPGSYTFNVPSNLNFVDILIVGAGGAGSGGWAWDGTNQNLGYGGSGGGLIFIRRFPVTPSSTVPVVVGAGGIANVSVPGNYSTFIGSGMGTNVYNSCVAAGSSSFNGFSASGGNVVANTAGSFGGFDPLGGDYSAGSDVSIIVGTTYAPYVFGENYIVIGGHSGYPINNGSSASCGGGGGAAGGYNATPNLIPGHGSQGSITGSSGTGISPKRGIPSLIHQMLNVGKGGGADVTSGTIYSPGYGGGGYGAGIPSSSAGYNSGQNGGGGLVVVFW